MNASDPPEPGTPDKKSTPDQLSFFNPDAETIKAHGAYLPHWQQAGEVMSFVTFRLADSLPQGKLQHLIKERTLWLEENPRPHSEDTATEYRRKFAGKIQTWLDAGYGSMLLGKPKIRTLVEGALRHFDGERYRLDEFVVAENHVHVLVSPMPGHSLAEILRSWKGYTANAIGKLTGTRGQPIWQQESWDHLVRSEEKLEKFRRYIRAH